MHSNRTFCLCLLVITFTSRWGFVCIFFIYVCTKYDRLADFELIWLRFRLLAFQSQCKTVQLNTDNIVYFMFKHSNLRHWGLRLFIDIHCAALRLTNERYDMQRTSFDRGVDLSEHDLNLRLNLTQNIQINVEDFEYCTGIQWTAFMCYRWWHDENVMWFWREMRAST